jgi:hypothetical protein
MGDNGSHQTIPCKSIEEALEIRDQIAVDRNALANPKSDPSLKWKMAANRQRMWAEGYPLSIEVDGDNTLLRQEEIPWPCASLEDAMACAVVLARAFDELRALEVK